MAKTESMTIHALIDLPGDHVRADDWFEATGAVELELDETYFATEEVVLRRRPPRLALATIALVIGGALVAAYWFRDGARERPDRPARLDDPAMTKVVAAAPAPAPAPAKLAAIPQPTRSPDRGTVAAAVPRHIDREAARRATGTLMISSKPPCSIVIDGVRTRLVTPQRSISLATGVHEITLLNDERQIRQSFPVTIVAKHSTRLIRDFMKD